MKLNEISNNKQIVIICGNISSGKGHYAKHFYPDYVCIHVSGIVKVLSGFKTRSGLGTTANLDQQITQKIIDEIDNPDLFGIKFDKFVIDGIRQPQILQALIKHYGSQIKDVIWLDVPKETLRARFTNRAAKKDDLSFDQALQVDHELGLGDIEQYIRKHGRVVPY